MVVRMEAPNSPEKYRRRRLLAAAAGLALIATAGYVVFAIRSGMSGDDPSGKPAAQQTASSSGDPMPTMQPDPNSPWSPRTPTPPPGAVVSWAYLNSAEGDTRTGGDDGLQDLNDLIVPAMAQDYLNAAEERDETVSSAERQKLAAAVTGDPGAITWLIEHRDGRNAAMLRIIDACYLNDARIDPPRATAEDIAGLGACLREGAIVQPEQAAWVLDQMRASTGGIADARSSGSAQNLAQINTIRRYDNDTYQAGCLAVGAWWSAAVIVRYPVERGPEYGKSVCRDVAIDAFPPDGRQLPDDLDTETREA